MEEEFLYKISKEQINDLPILYFEGDIHVFSDKDKDEKYDKYLESLSKESELGFDTESRPSFKKGVFHPISLIQISTEKEAFLFRINMIGIPDRLKSILENKNIKKIGLGLHNELRELEDRFKVECKGFVDLEKIAARNKFKQRGLRALSAFFLNHRISKTAQKSNWERKEFTPSQIRYAATDAWAALEIYKKMGKNNFLN